MSKLKFINKVQVLPKEYVPTEKIDFCGNMISSYKYLISDGGFYPILIGKGEILRVWLFAKNPNNEIITLVDDSVSNINQIKVDIFNTEKRIEIRDIERKKVILKLKYGKVPAIESLDMTPMGYNIQGDKEKLVVGSTNISGNSFTNVQTIIALGPN